MLEARQTRRLAWSELKDEARKGFENKVLRREGQHRHEYEDRKSFSLRLLPDLFERFLETWFFLLSL